MNALKVIIYISLLFLNWVPRILCILFAIGISLFALDAFDNDEGFWKTLLALLIHLIPTFIVIAVLLLSWRWPWVGGVIYVLLGISYLIWSSRSGRESSIISIPLFSIGILFIINWFLRKKIEEAKEAYEEGL